MRNVALRPWLAEFAPVLRRAGLSVSSAHSVAVALHALYGEKSRVYHASFHPLWMMRQVRKHRLHFSSAQELAVLFHDAVYVVAGKTNEAQSADLLHALLDGHGPEPALLKEAADIVLDTQQHFVKTPRFRRASSALVLDIDISNMAQPWAEFLRWNKAVEKEYSAWPQAGRNAFLKQFLARPSIIQSKELLGLEKRIRKNLQRLLKDRGIALDDVPAAD